MFTAFGDLKLSWMVQKRSNEKVNIKIAKENKNLIQGLLPVVLFFKQLVTTGKSPDLNRIIL